MPELLAVSASTAIVIVVCSLVGSAIVMKVGGSLLLRHFERTADTPEEAAGYRELRENPPKTKIMPDGDTSSPSHSTYT